MGTDFANGLSPTVGCSSGGVVRRGISVCLRQRASTLIATSYDDAVVMEQGSTAT